MKVCCSICDASRIFLNDATDKEIENNGFFIWGHNADGSMFCTCVKCAENPDNYTSTNPVTIKSPDQLAKREKTVVISGLFLGHPNTNREAILSIINGDYSRIIINGDIIDCVYHKQLTNWDYVILKCLENHQEQGKAIIIRGEEECWSHIEKYTTLKLVDNYTWDYFGLKFYATNGYNLNSYVGYKERAVELAKRNKYSAIFTGHIDEPNLLKIDDIIYVNTGNFKNDKYHWSVMSNKVNLVRLLDNISFKHKKNKDNTKTTQQVIKIPEIAPPQIFDLPRENNKQLLEF